jgi:amidase
MTDPHPASTEIAYLSTADIVERLNDGRLTSSQLIDVLLGRREAIDVPGTTIALNSIAAISSDARDMARERDDERAKGVIRGALHGVPVLIKDNIEAVGLPGLAGSTSLIGRPTRDAPLVTRLRDAGAIVLGCTNLSQWANIRSMRSTSGYSSSAGLVGNPWALDRSAGGSSSGTGAGVAAGLAPLGVGTETDGSIVCPASVNGIAGLKPTVGTVPKQYVIPISESQDSPGPMGRSVADVALLYGVLSATSPPEATSRPSIAAATNWRTGNPETDQLYDDVVTLLSESGLSVTPRELALPDEQVFQDELTVMLAELVDGMSTYLSNRPGDGVKSLADVIAYEDEHRDTELVYFGHDLFTKAIDIGGTDTPAYAEAHPRNLAWAIDTCLNPGLEGVDVIIAPAYGPSWKSDLAVGGHPGPASCATMAPAIAGWPIMCIPLGLVKDLPVGLAIIGRAHSEWTILDAARRIEAVLATHSPMPMPYWKLPSRG